MRIISNSDNNLRTSIVFSLLAAFGCASASEGNSAINTGAGGTSNILGGMAGAHAGEAQGGATAQAGAAGTVVSGGSAAGGAQNSAGQATGGALATADAGTIVQPPTDGDVLIDCNPMHALCRILAEPCPQGEVRAIEGTCWGDCVGIERCACSQPSDCPAPETYTCINLFGRCSPYLN